MPRTKTPDDSAIYLLKRIPGPLWDRAKAKAAEHRPPLSMRWVLIQLLEKWTDTVPMVTGETRADLSPASVAKPPRVRRPATPKAAKPIPAAPMAPLDDLGGIF